jgi:hypothetical protein
MKRNGVGFIHHSNLGQFQEKLALAERIPPSLRHFVIDKKFLNPTHYRAPSMTARLFESYCDKAGLQCISQELINWGSPEFVIDCFSLFTPKSSIFTRANKVTENTEFLYEVSSAKRLSNHYSFKSFQIKQNDQDRHKKVIGI